LTTVGTEAYRSAPWVMVAPILERCYVARGRRAGATIAALDGLRAERSSSMKRAHSTKTDAEPGGA
jgi:hypothetical protein